MNIYTSETEYLKTEVQRLRALVRAQQITIDKLEAQSEQDYPENFIHALAFHTAISDLEPEQEPVAYLCENAVGHKYFRWKKPSSTYKPVALYTTPPQRTWVGLTDEEIKAFDTWHDNREEEKGWVAPSEIVAYLDTKFKEKNHG